MDTIQDEKLRRREATEILINLEAFNTLTNSLSSREMDSLTAICDTFLPSIDAATEDEPTRTFYRTSASMMGTPEIVGRYMSGKLKHVMLWILRLALWFLSTWYGTFSICGTRSLSRRFPYFRRFSEVELHRREEILLSLSHSSFILYRMLFKALKFLVPLFYFTQVDDKNQNPTWKALGYCGPDPDFRKETKRIRESNWKDQERHQTGSNRQGDESESNRFGPLQNALVDLDRPKDAISAALGRAGLSLSAGPHPTIRCDAVIVGSGSGGGVVAGVLAKAGYKVVVLEKGTYASRQNLTLLEGHAMDTMYEGSGLLTTNDIGVVVLSGSTVGGGSSINWSASIRTPDHVLNEWCNNHGLELFRSEAYMEAMDVVCERMGVQGEVDEDGLHNAVLRRGCKELGYPVCNIPRNSTSDHYCGWCCFGCKDGRKKGTAETWLVDMEESGNGVILPGCRAVKVLKEKKKGKKRHVATGVLFEHKKATYVVESKVTVVACGALGTPVLLKRSGLKNKNIGRNLHLHPVVMVWGTFSSEEEKRSYEGGIMTAMSKVVANMETTGYGALIQTPALHPGMFSVLMPWTSAAEFKERMTKFSRTAHIFALARDKGSGTVGVGMEKSMTYDMEEEDEENLKKGLEKMLRIMAAAGAEEIGTHRCNGERLDVKKVSSHEFERFVKEVSGRGVRGGEEWTPVCSAHQMGSCRMGVEERTSAVDGRGEAWEVEGLFVADTSVFPTALGVNPMVTVQAIAYHTAMAVVDVLRGSKRTGSK